MFIKRKIKEKRKFPRADVYLLFRYKLLGEGQTRDMLTSLVNISACGLLGRVYSPLQINDIILIELNLVGIIERVISLKGRVVRLKRRRRYWEVGIEFIDISPQDEEVINQCVHWFKYGKDKT